MADVTVTFQPAGKRVVLPRQTTLLAAASAAGVRLHTPCGGQGRCGKCLVQAEGALAAPTPTEQRILSTGQLAQGWRLACQARLAGEVTVIVPPSSVLTDHRIMVEGAEREIAVQPNVTKVSLQLPRPSVEDARTDLNRVLDAVAGVEAATPSRTLSPPDSIAALQSLPRVLRGSDFRVTAVMAGGRLLAVEPGDTSDDSYGLAIDIGTTTVVAYLCHLPTGRSVAVASDLNSQAQYGDDVISRIQLASAGGDGLAALSRCVIAVINDLVERACHQAGVSEEAIYELAVVGNACMSHLFLGVSPVGLGSLPFVQSFRSAPNVRAADLGIGVHPEALVYVVPNIGGFVGADTVGVILAGELDRSNSLRVAVDIGTNGEIVVARDGELYAASTAAGPAFEGAKISRGMRAALGAIDRVHIGDDVACHVIGEVAPRGLCGSGLVDAVAELVRVGAVTETGRMLRRQETTGLPEKVAARLAENDEGASFVLARPEESYGGEGVSLTGRDVREMQLAKAAIYGGMEVLLQELGAHPMGIEELLLAGAFGNYIGRDSARAVGLIPALPADRIRSIGNAAGVGARLVLCSTEERRRAEEIARRVRHVDLSERKGFYDRFTDAMMLRPLPR